MNGPSRRYVISAFLVLSATVFSGTAGAQFQPAAYYEQNCAACHSIGAGRVVGPDLKDVTQRASRAWLLEFIRNPEARIKAQDAYAVRIMRESDGITMPPYGDLTDPQGELLLNYIEQKSRGGDSARASGAEAPASAEDILLGRELFEGARRLQNGGVACVACHDAAGSETSGGRLGPGLSLVSERLGGRPGLTAWLGNPPTRVMSSTYRPRPFTPAEVQALSAFLEQAPGNARQPRRSVAGRVQLFGLGGAVFGLVFAGVAGRKRLRGVRRAMVSKRGER